MPERNIPASIRQRNSSDTDLMDAVLRDTQPENEPAIALYSKLGVREEALHFDIPVTGTNR